jgi:hypothetical protein
MFMNSSSYWDISKCSWFKVNQHIGGTCHHHLECQRVSQERNQRDGIRKQSSAWKNVLWPIWRHYLCIHLEGLRKTMTNLSQDGLCPGQDSYLARNKYKTEALWFVWNCGILFYSVTKSLRMKWLVPVTCTQEIITAYNILVTHLKNRDHMGS